AQQCQPESLLHHHLENVSRRSTESHSYTNEVCLLAHRVRDNSVNTNRRQHQRDPCKNTHHQSRKPPHERGGRLRNHCVHCSDVKNRSLWFETADFVANSSRKGCGVTICSYNQVRKDRRTLTKRVIEHWLNRLIETRDLYVTNHADYQFRRCFDTGIFDLSTNRVATGKHSVSDTLADDNYTLAVRLIARVKVSSRK